MIRLDLGAGSVSPPGFIPLGRDHGSEIWPLPYADESVDEIRASHVLEAMGVEPALARGALRISFGWASSESDVDRFCETFQKTVRDIRARRASLAART